MVVPVTVGRLALLLHLIIIALLRDLTCIGSDPHLLGH
jgi:hypothetical protein